MMNEEQSVRESVRDSITESKTALGIEFGSTRIKAVLIDENYRTIAAGFHDWENRLENGLWTYSLDDIRLGLQNSFRNMVSDVKNRYDTELNSVGAIGISAMMHGYLAFDEKGNLLAPFRTWRNTMTKQSAEELSALFQFNIPQRWSIAHFYQAILNKEPHVQNVAFMTSLAGYVHWKLTGEKTLGLNDASGVFPVDSNTNAYDEKMLQQFDTLVSAHSFNRKTKDILPNIVCAGKKAGILSAEGAKLLDPEGRIKAGIPFCPPEGDAGTGMVATNSVAERTGNVSAGTSVFAMIVLEKPLSRVYPEIDVLATPAGKPVAMVHCNNCTTDLDAWIKMLNEAVELFGGQVDRETLYKVLYSKALEGEDDCGGLLSYNYYSGEHLTDIEQGRPLFVRLPDSNLTLANFMRTLLFSSMGTLKLGMDILTEKEGVKLDSLLGHGGLFKTKGVGQLLMAGALNTPVTVTEDAGEGGAWGIALLASFMLEGGGISLEKFLAEKVFAEKSGSASEPNVKDIQGFKRFMARYLAGLPIERSAVENL